MCDDSGKLIAWLDRELPPQEAAEVEQHLEACAECRGRVDSYRRVSDDFAAYCEETLASSKRRGTRRTSPWTAVTAAVAATATLVALLMIWPRPHVQPPTAGHLPLAMMASPTVVENTIPAPIDPAQEIRRRHAAPVASAQVQDMDRAPVQNPSAHLMPEAPVIQIAFPADEMFPPGAVPPGMHFVADVTFAADGTAEGLRLHPRFAGFERRTTDP